MYDAILHNLMNVGWAMLIFVCAYLSNMTFSLYHNIKQLGQAFEYNKIINSVWKVGSLVVGMTLLTISITALPEFANYIGWTIPEEYTQVFGDLAIIGSCLLVSCKYVAEAAKKLIAILNPQDADQGGDAT